MKVSSGFMMEKTGRINGEPKPVFMGMVSSEMTQLSLSSLPAAGRVRISATGILFSPGLVLPEIRSHTSPYNKHRKTWLYRYQ